MIESAYQQLQIISQNQEKRLEYEAREKAVRDHLQYMREAEERGLEQGRQETSIDIAKKMVALDVSTEIISKGTGLSVEFIESLRK